MTAPKRVNIFNTQLAASCRYFARMSGKKRLVTTLDWYAIDADQFTLAWLEELTVEIIRITPNTHTRLR